MIDFDEELKKYEPVLDLDGVEKSVHQSETKDVIDMLQYITKSMGERV